MGAGKFSLAALFFVVVIADSVYGQPYLQWSRTYGGNEDDEANSVQVLDDGGYIVAGYTESRGSGGSDVWLLRTDSAGDTLWTRVYGGSSNDQGISIQITPDGGYIIAGWTESFGSGGKDYYLIRTNSIGDILWTRTYGGSNDDVVTSINLTNDGGYILTGYTSGYTSNIIKTNASGDSLWSYTFPDGVAYSAKQTSDGGYIIVGLCYFLYLRSRVYAVKLDSNGNMQWDRQYYFYNEYEQTRTSWNHGRDVVQTSDGGFLIVGYCGLCDWSIPLFPIGYQEAFALKTDSLGFQVDNWCSNNNYYEAYCVQQTESGGYIIGGTKYYDRYGDFDLYPDLTVLFKLNTALEVEWMSTYGGEEGRFVQIAPDRGYVIVGNHDYEHPDVYIVKTGPDEPLIRPEIELSASELQFGQVPVGYQEELSFMIYNVGDTTLTLYDIVSSHACFTTDFNPDSGIAEPGDSLNVTVFFNPNSYINYNERLSIISCIELIRVQLHGRGIPWIEASSETFEFGEVHLGSSAYLPLMIHNLCDSSVVIREITTSEISFSTTFDPADSVLAPYDSLNVMVVFVPHDSTVYNETLQIISNRGDLGLLLTGLGIPSFMVSSHRLEFGNVEVGDSSELSLTVYNISDSLLAVYAVTITDTSYTSSFDSADSLIGAGDSLQITVTFSPSAPYVWYNDILTLLGRFEEISVRLIGRGIPSSAVGDWLVGIPKEFMIHPAYPNPFNSQATIKYDVPVMGDVEILVYDVLGRKVGTLVKESKDIGYHQVCWDAGELPSGVYFVQMEAGNYRQVQKVVLLK